MKMMKVVGEEKLKYKDGRALCPKCSGIMQLFLFGYKCMECGHVMYSGLIAKVIEKQREDKG